MPVRDEPAQLTRLHQSLGRAVAAWAMVEAGMSEVFGACLYPTVFHRRIGSKQSIDNGVAAAIFYAVDSFRAKLAITDAAVCSIIQPTSDEFASLLRDWRKLHDKSRKLSLKRNRLAHWMIMAHVEGVTDTHALVPSGFGPDYESAVAENKVLTATRIDHLDLAFKLLAGKAFAFANALSRSEELQGKFVEQEAHWKASIAARDLSDREHPERPQPSGE